MIILSDDVPFQANQAEREMMSFVLSLELRDQNEKISPAIIANGVHQDLAASLVPSDIITIF